MFPIWEKIYSQIGKMMVDFQNLEMQNYIKYIIIQ